MFRIEECSQRLSLPKDTGNLDMTYDLLKPFAKARIHYEGGELVYTLIEPKIGEEEEEITEKLHQGLLQLIDLSPSEVKTQEELIKYLEEKIRFLLKEYGISLSAEQHRIIMYYVYRNFVGLNEIEALMHDDYIEDINCNGVNTPIYIKHRLFGNIKSSVSFGDRESLKNFIIKLAQRSEKYITYSDPFLEGSMPDGSRVQGTISEDVSPRGPNFSIRKFRRVPFSPTELMQSNTISSEALAYLWYLIENGANILIIGGAGAGKTTLLNVLATFIPGKSKIVSIEDTREVKLFHENWTATIARESVGGMHMGEVSLNKLLRESFRENPDYVIVGEVRGKETYIMFQGMASGHPTMATFHSEDVNSVLNRLKTPPISLPPALIELLDVVITIHRSEKGKSTFRRVSKIEEFEEIDQKTGKAVTHTISLWNSKNDSFAYSSQSRVIRKLAEKSGSGLKDVEVELKRRKILLENLVKKGVFDIGGVHVEIQKYYSRDRG
ncbi:MAG: type II/IV secretion system ATPase subunit [Candidatus Aenigmatarchaeota archaeon]